jgi:hypothetical protein
VGTDAFKLIYFWKKNQWELYDLARDPEELLNVYADPAYTDTVRILNEELYRLKKEVGDLDQFADTQPPPGVDGQPPPKPGGPVNKE